MKAMTIDAPGSNWILELCIVYQLYYMWSEKCKIDETFNDLYIFVWNDELDGDQFVQNMASKWLYMLRDINNLGITIYEGIPEHQAEHLD